MSETFFITPFNPAPWQNLGGSLETPSSELVIDIDRLCTEFRQLWPDAEVRDFGDELSLSMIEGSDIGIEIIIRDKQIVTFKPFNSEFVLWYRRFIDLQYPLYLSGSSSAEQLQLTERTSESDLEAFLGKN
jgi:hypothetical protein